ncbi:hypothetical protein [Bathymodiolus thermophilus thioautotrophic gill symbiont]|nr:hypothetical protein [Bathymodiolus thermophilus thioautotrophic gill symbiont]
MGKIYIESKEVDVPFNIDGSNDHLYLVCQNDNGNKNIIRGG